MPKLIKQQERESEETLRQAEFIGRNTYGQHSSLIPGDFREIENYDVFPRYLKSRRGSQLMRDGAKGKLTVGLVLNEITWDVGEFEYLIYAQWRYDGVHIYYQQIYPTVDDPKSVTDLNGNDTYIPSPYDYDRPDFFLDGDKLFVMHSLGNKIIHYNALNNRFEMRPLGLKYPYIESAVANSHSVPPGEGSNGTHVYAVELIYFPDNLSDISYSSPNRYMTSRKICKVTGTEFSTVIILRPDELDATTWWTHIRLWKSLRTDSDLTNPANPIDAAGVEDELYLVAEISKAEIERPSLLPVEVGEDKPKGNEFVTAGTTGGDYVIVDACPDEYLTYQIGVDYIELSPMPASRVGVSHGGLIFVSNVADATLATGERIDDDSRNDIWYSKHAGSPYSELTTGLQIIPTIRNGQRMVKLISFEKDLIGLKESSTVRLPDGLVDLNLETIDHRIGIQNVTSATFIPGLGICAITNDADDFAILGFDMIWRKTFNSIDTARAIREDLASINHSMVSMIYLNGKLFLSDGTGTCYILNVESGRGWSKFVYQTTEINGLVTFNGGRRGMAIRENAYSLEIEVKGLDTDDNQDNEGTLLPITLSHTTFMFSSGDGADVLEQQWYSIMAYLTDKMVGVPYVNGLPWPNKTTPLGWTFVGQDGGYAALADREYRLYIKPQTMGKFKWMPPVGNWIHFVVKTVAPAIIKVSKLRCIVDTDGISFGGFDPFQVYSEPFGPSWDSISKIIETGDDEDPTITETGSGSEDVITEVGDS